MAKRQQTEAEWWKEDAERLNRLCRDLKEAGATADVPDGPQPDEDCCDPEEEG